MRIKTARWNPVDSRKEWRERGSPIIVVGGGVVINPEVQEVNLSASPSPATTGQMITLTTAVVGGTSPYTYTYVQTGGTAVTLSGSGNTRTFTAPSTATNLTFRATVVDSLGSTEQGIVSLTVSESVSEQVVFAGHKPYQVMVGMASPESGPVVPLYDEAFGIVNKTLHERRIFKGENISLSALRNMLDECDSRSQFGVTSFKHSNFDDFYEGRMDATLNIIRDEMILRRTSGAGGSKKPPHAVGIYHEPAGDAGIVLSEWAKMQIYCSNYFAGKKPNGPNGTGTLVYTAANDVRDMMTWHSIMNGNKWGPNRVDNVMINDAHPQLLIDTYRINNSILGADFYDGIPTSGELADYKVTSDRTSMKIQAYIDWHRDRNCGMLFAGEYSTTQATECYKVWEVVRANRDIFCILNYFNSAQNSKWEWRLIPSTYPQTSGVKLDQYKPGNYVEIGGTTATRDQLATFRTIVDESKQAQYIGPIGN